MADYNEVTDPEVLPGRPITSSLMYRLANNPIGIALRAIDAPRVMPATINPIWTVGSGNFTVPAGVYRLRYILIGGGGGGGGSNAANANGGGGGSGALSIGTLDVTPGQSVPYTVAAGGAGGGSTANGSTGGTTSIGPGGAQYQALGGAGGTRGQTGPSDGVGGAGGAAGGIYGQTGFRGEVPRGARDQYGVGKGGDGSTGTGSGAAGQIGGIILEY